MRKNIVAGNWKMNLNHAEGLQLFAEILNLVNSDIKGNQEVVICPPFVHISSLAQLLKADSNVSVGAQNCHQADSGAYTGEISASMLKSSGATYVIIGHSERRAFFAEDDLVLAQKLDSVLKNELTPIFCIGETLEQRNAGTHFDVIESQLKEASFHLNDGQFRQLVLAYEPVWAIGTGLTATPEQAQEVHAFIRSKVSEHYGAELANDLTILYGGSCNPKNAADLFSQADIDGGLIGGASLKALDFIDIIKVFNS
ncbi:triose-phosphate isomerase [Daejeonella lutea]|uniref:Triosephosphate isomerase n=1 Tax=Daejeonella lutea TaxID=572036 RepID=A0A1T5B8H2_9SPHI|nr:triose-phosphate isomerase [Daejeonella lutea]SKB43193.1 triosephosphate isomerase [Daejeonella lutea]